MVLSSLAEATISGLRRVGKTELTMPLCPTNEAFHSPSSASNK